MINGCTYKHTHAAELLEIHSDSQIGQSEIKAMLSGFADVSGLEFKDDSKAYPSGKNIVHMRLLNGVGEDVLVVMDVKEDNAITVSIYDNGHDEWASIADEFDEYVRRELREPTIERTTDAR